MSVTFTPNLYPLPTEAPSLNVSNSNAAALLDRLGLSNQPWGCADSVDVLGRAMTANVGLDDSGVAPSTDGRFVDCGLRAGYFDDRVAELAEVAAWARDHGVDISWG